MDKKDPNSATLMPIKSAVLEPSENSETVTSASSADLRAWLFDLDKHGYELLDALREGRVKVTTTSGFNELANLASYARQYAKDRAELADQNAALIQQKVLFQSTIFYLLKSFEGIAANADKVIETCGLLGIENGKMSSMGIMGLMTNYTMNARKVNGNVEAIANVFDPAWLQKIDLKGLKTLMEETELDLSGYDRLNEILQAMYPAKTSELPA